MLAYITAEGEDVGKPICYASLLQTATEYKRGYRISKLRSVPIRTLISSREQGIVLCWGISSLYFSNPNL